MFLTNSLYHLIWSHCGRIGSCISLHTSSFWPTHRSISSFSGLHLDLQLRYEKIIAPLHVPWTFHLLAEIAAFYLIVISFKKLNSPYMVARTGDLFIFPPGKHSNPFPSWNIEKGGIISCYAPQNRHIHQPVTKHGM